MGEPGICESRFRYNNRIRMWVESFQCECSSVCIMWSVICCVILFASCWCWRCRLWWRPRWLHGGVLLICWQRMSRALLWVYSKIWLFISANLDARMSIHEKPLQYIFLNSYTQGSNPLLLFATDHIVVCDWKGGGRESKIERCPFLEVFNCFQNNA
jgi:hypothetical protein